MRSNLEYTKWLLLIMKSDSSSAWSMQDLSPDQLLEPEFKRQALQAGRLRVPIQLPEDGLRCVSEDLTLKPFRHLMDVINAVEEHFTTGSQKQRVLKSIAWSQAALLRRLPLNQKPWTTRPTYGIWQNDRLIAIKWQSDNSPGKWFGSWNHTGYGCPPDNMRAINQQLRALLTEHRTVKTFDRKRKRIRAEWDWLAKNGLVQNHRVVLYDTYERSSHLIQWYVQNPTSYTIDKAFADVTAVAAKWRSDPISVNMFQFVNA